MPRISSLKRAKKDILAHFTKDKGSVYAERDLDSILSLKRQHWRITKSTTTDTFIEFLSNEGSLRRYSFEAENYGKRITRYAWKKASALALAISFRARGYLCHGTAATVHGLGSADPNTIFLNNEQSPKPRPNNPLTQEGIRLAFSRKQRQSNLRYQCEGVSIVMISGKNTDNFGVESLKGSENETLRATNLERTLIDMVVRPSYSGGITSVLNAYRAARGKVTAKPLLKVLKTLDHVYPYHQAVGFLMEAANFPDKDCALLQKLGLHHDFYLTHGMIETEFCDRWRLNYPKELLSH
jgi:predicted transcriptional regulator of viral defense system